jgi:hypothetical protein
LLIFQNDKLLRVFGGGKKTEKLLSKTHREGISSFFFSLFGACSFYGKEKKENLWTLFVILKELLVCQLFLANFYDLQ